MHLEHEVAARREIDALDARRVGLGLELGRNPAREVNVNARVADEEVSHWIPPVARPGGRSVKLNLNTGGQVADPRTEYRWIPRPPPTTMIVERGCMSGLGRRPWNSPR